MRHSRQVSLKKSKGAVLPGFGPMTTAALREIGITNLDQLLTRDPFEVYSKLKKKIPRTSLNFLYALIAAAEKSDWRTIQKTRRTAILLRLESMGIAPK